MNNSFIKAIWEKNEKRHKLPSRCRNIIISDFEEIKLKIREKNQSYLEELIENIYQGDFYILKNSFSKEFMEDLKDKTFNYFKNKESEFHKMLEGTPDFHRIIDLEINCIKAV